MFANTIAQSHLSPPALPLMPRPPQPPQPPQRGRALHFPDRAAGRRAGLEERSLDHDMPLRPVAEAERSLITFRAASLWSRAGRSTTSSIYKTKCSMEDSENSAVSLNNTRSSSGLYPSHISYGPTPAGRWAPLGAPVESKQETLTELIWMQNNICLFTR